MHRIVRVTWDQSHDLGYVYFTEIGPGGVARTFACPPGEVSGSMINLDFDEQGRLLGIEIADASKVLPAGFLEGAPGSDGEPRGTPFPRPASWRELYALQPGVPGACAADPPVRRSERPGASPDEAWRRLLRVLEQIPGTLLQPFPLADPSCSPDLTGRLVRLTGLAYPRDVFENNGIPHGFVGSPADGFCFVYLAPLRGPHGAAEPPSDFERLWAAVKRWAAAARAALPGSCSLVGRIRGPRLMVPGRDAEGLTLGAQLGWQVDPWALYVAGSLLAVLDDGHPAGASYVGEPGGALPPFLR